MQFVEHLCDISHGHAADVDVFRQYVERID